MEFTSNKKVFMKKDLFAIIIRLFILFHLAFNFHEKIDAKTGIKSQKKGGFSSFGLPPTTQSISQKEAEKIQTILTEALLTLQRFEGILDNITNIISQKFSNMQSTQALRAEKCIKKVHEMRSQLYQAREKISETKPKNLEQMRPILSHIGYLLSIAVEYARSLDFSLINKFKKIKQFNFEATLKRSGQKDQAKFLTKNMFELQDLSVNIEQALNDFDITTMNKVFQFANNWFINPFFKYYGSSILYYGTIWGIPTSLFLWQWGGKIANNEEVNFLAHNNRLTGYHMDPQETQRKLFTERLLIEDTSGEGKGVGIYKQLQPNKPFELTSDYHKTLGKGLRFFYWLTNGNKFFRTGLPSSYFSAPGMPLDPNKGAMYGYLKNQLFENKKVLYKNKILSPIDDTLTGLFSQQYPILTAAFPLIWPTIKETWTKSIWPTISGNINGLWNKLMGGVFENRSIDGVFDLIIDNLTLDDIIGMENEKAQFQILIEYLLNPITFMNRHGNKIDKAFVFTGVTRTGKTFTYKAFVGELQKRLRILGRSVRSIRAFEFPVHIVKQVGISQIIAFMKTNAPAVFFIDEIDLVQLQRSTDSTILADFLTALGNVLNDDPARPIILFCATNKIENLDPALLTKGRLGEEIRFEYPSYSYRKEFLEKLLKKHGLMNRKIDIDALVQQLGEQAYETINYILHGAMMRASIGGVPFSQEHLEEAINRSIRGIMSTSRKDLVDVELKILAAHFAGHITIWLLLELLEVLHTVTIKAFTPKVMEKSVYADLYQKEDQKQKKIVYGSTFISAKGDSDKLATREMRILTIKRLLSGYIAEELLLGSCGYTCHIEYKKEAYDMTLGLLLAGIEYDSLSDSMKTEYTKRAIELLDQYMQEVRLLFTENIDLLRYMSEALLDKEILSQKEILELYEEFKQKKEEERLEKEKNQIDQEEAVTEENEEQIIV